MKDKRHIQSFNEHKENLNIAEGLEGLSLIQAKEAAMIEGKKIRHRSFMDYEYIYYKNGCWFTYDGYQLPEVHWLDTQEQGWEDSWSADGWSVVS